MSKIEVNQIDTISGSSTLLVGPTAATKLTFSSTLTVDFNVNSPGVTLNDTMKMTPAFEAYLGSDQTISGGVATKVQCGSEVYDTNSAYDNSTNYRFTVPAGLGGKYYFYGGIKAQTSSADSILNMSVYLYKNGSQARRNEYFITTSNSVTVFGASINQVLDLSAGDYIELYGMITISGSTPRYDAGGTGGATYFGGYRIIGA